MRITIETKPDERSVLDVINDQATYLAEARTSHRAANNALYETEVKLRSAESKIRELEAQLRSGGKSGPPIANITQAQVRALVGATSVGKIQGIKMIREITGLGLKEAKDLFEDGVNSAKEENDRLRRERGY